MTADVHYEVFIKRSRKAAWTLVCACESKAEAFKLTETLLKETPGASLRATKEKFETEHGAFRTYTILEVGEKFEEDDRADRTAELPCRSPTDLCNAHSRETIGRVLKEWLTRQVATPLELLHRVDLVEKLEASDTEYQHAVQKVAIASASTKDANVQHFIKQINDLLQRAIKTLYVTHRTASFPKITSGNFAAIVADIAKGKDKDFRLRGAIALHLKDARTWKSKFERALSLADEAVSIGAPQSEWPLSLVGEYIADLVDVDEARATLLGMAQDLGDELDAFTDMLRSPKGKRLSMVGRRLAQHFANRTFVDSQRIIARRIVEGLMKPKRLKPDSIRAEIELNRSIADRLIFSVGTLLSQDALVETFIFRSGRLLDDASITAFLAAARSVSDEVLDLIELEDNIVGDANKAKLAGYIRASLGGHPAENHFLKGGEAPTRRLAELAAIRAKLDAAKFAEGDATDIAAKIDTFAIAIEHKAKLFDQIARRAASPLDAAATYLRLIEKGVAPEGRLADHARNRAMDLLASREMNELLAQGDPEHLKLAREISNQLTEAQSAATAEQSTNRSAA